MKTAARSGFFCTLHDSKSTCQIRYTKRHIRLSGKHKNRLIETP